MTDKLPVLSKSLEQQASVIALIVQNELTLGLKLSNAQVDKMAPIVRDAIATALHALEHSHKSKSAKQYLEPFLRDVPDNWKSPTLLESYRKFWKA